MRKSVSMIETQSKVHKAYNVKDFHATEDGWKCWLRSENGNETEASKQTTNELF